MTTISLEANRYIGTPADEIADGPGHGAGQQHPGEHAADHRAHDFPATFGIGEGGCGRYDDLRGHIGQPDHVVQRQHEHQADGEQRLRDRDGHADQPGADVEIGADQVQQRLDVVQVRDDRAGGYRQHGHLAPAQRRRRGRVSRTALILSAPFPISVPEFERYPQCAAAEPVVQDIFGLL
ncbi:hypothetical protein QMK19_34710 [Streptomyces sp. H10-C2]|uniref:hypothetical protein n=1 Tax=unclassified Streptomyces TaxID=2593676 RepID=UPI0024B9E914|nr:MULTISPECIES: hypothetical protein [unclassified Streptomyces]MDJ0345748.1 hypothetical protein [Streptomyces sp. PH10-H1]MDJ0374638.1 hypothetical protein [Streptomyces sp. H10-C2]